MAIGPSQNGGLNAILQTTKIIRLTTKKQKGTKMKFLLILLLWVILLVLCWPIALLLLIFWPILWLLSIPFRIVGAAMEALMALVKALLFLPARLLGGKEK